MEWTSCCCSTKESSKSDCEAKTESSNSWVAKAESSKINGSNMSAEPFPLEGAGTGNVGVVACSMNLLALLVPWALQSIACLRLVIGH